GWRILPAIDESPEQQTKIYGEARRIDIKVECKRSNTHDFSPCRKGSTPSSVIHKWNTKSQPGCRKKVVQPKPRQPCLQVTHLPAIWLHVCMHLCSDFLK
ncbi:hypothetical protein CEXT_4231, partial [Caerostris extrusa]